MNIRDVVLAVLTLIVVAALLPTGVNIFYSSTFGTAVPSYITTLFFLIPLFVIIAVLLAFFESHRGI